MIIKRVMKGALVEDLEKVIFPILASPKIDGFRCIVSDIARTSRMGEFPNRYVHKSLKGLLPPEVFLDGEIVVGKRRGEGVLNRTSSGVTSEEGEPDWRLWVFDAPRDAVRFVDRLKLAKSHIKEIGHPKIRLLKHELIEDPDELQAYLDQALLRGFEGICGRSIDGPYKQGKSTLREGYLWKIKPFETHEAQITDYFEEMENTNEQTRDATGKAKRSSAKAGKKPKGTLGGFIGIDTKSGVEVRCGSGFSAEQRKDFWRRRKELKGSYFTYKSQKMGVKDKPRHTVFCHLRPSWDITD